VRLIRGTGAFSTRRSTELSSLISVDPENQPRTSLPGTHLRNVAPKTNRIALPRNACLEENTTWDLVKYVKHNICDQVQLVKPPAPGTSKRSENISELKSGMCLEGPGYAEAGDTDLDP
jgi:hypothetical protein